MVWKGTFFSIRWVKCVIHTFWYHRSNSKKMIIWLIELDMVFKPILFHENYFLYWWGTKCVRVTCVNLHGDNHITDSAVPSLYGQPTYFWRLTSTRVGFEGVHVCQTTGHFKHFGDVGFVPQATRVPVRMVLNRKHNTLSFSHPPPPHKRWMFSNSHEWRIQGKIYM